ncbi:MAG: hypothetical protein M0Z54_08580 [Thermaerobacter sp.]|nr:hypothetical protein [Thermaerobacter sp.]
MAITSGSRWPRLMGAALALTVPLAATACGATNPAPQKNPTSRPPAHHSSGSQTGTAKAGSKGKRSGATVKALPLTTLPPLTYEKNLNRWLKHTHEISSFIPGMGYHWAAPFPSLVLMANNVDQVTAVEADFPQKLGTYPWYDPPDTAPNGGVAFNSEHLYFVSPTAITPTMSATLPTNLGSWASFEMANPRLTSTYAKSPTTYRGDAVYAPKSGPAIKVLVASSGKIAGFMVSEPASWGWRPGYAEAQGKPVKSPQYGTAYHSVLWLLPNKMAHSQTGTARTGVKRAGRAVKRGGKTLVHKAKTGTKTAVHDTKRAGNKVVNQTKSGTSGTT